jgi:flagellar biosynthesis protein FlhF
MNAQVFRGRTAIEAHRAALEQLGPEAIVLTTRSVTRTGVGGWFGASDIEIAATLPERSAIPVRSAVSEARFAPGAYANSMSRESKSEVAALRAELKGDIRSLKTMLVKSGDSADLASEIAQLRELVEALSGAQPRRDKALVQLRALGVEGPACNAIVRALRGKGDAETALREELGRILPAVAWPLEAAGQSMIAVIGPSGVGKTTTAAKLAARARMDGKTVTLVACDTYRVGAVEQLAAYAELMGADLATAHTADQLNAIIDGARTDVVIVDTSGRPPAVDGVEIALAAPRGPHKTAPSRRRHVLLCLPAALRANDAARLVRRYGTLTPTSLAMTKIDETDAPAGIVHASWASKLPVSVVCFGQRVPEDIAPATVGTLVDYLAPLKARRAGQA